MPGFALAPGEPMRLRGGVIRMNLDREPLACEQVLDQQLWLTKAAPVRNLEPDFADGLLARAYVVEPRSK
ncbi:hypothetical protein DAH87_24265 [Sphingomonas koreensis]|nr:hypothetical protein DAH54_22995 [Sphingomonas koreensis]RSV54281.1 hypothetical protein CA229_14595 [Sphingomonas koreensis]RSX88434.1 hypothetical protein DAH87_24265 [Sphingomonas koreensis]